MWTTDDLSTVPGIILYQQWLETIKPGHSCYYEHTSSHDIEMHQGTVDLYLCKDGKTISNSELYAGDKDIYSTFRNRDPRMYHTIMPPYKVVDGKAQSNPVQVTRVNGGREFIVDEGLVPGDVIVAEGVGLLREGTPVKAKAAQTPVAGVTNANQSSSTETTTKSPATTTEN